MLRSISLLLLFLPIGINSELNSSKIRVWGPGLKPDIITTPARYFFIETIDENELSAENIKLSEFHVEIEGRSSQGKCLYRLEKINRGDGTIIVRYKTFKICKNVKIHVFYKNMHIARSPYIIKGLVYSEECDCPWELETLMKNYECRADEAQINSDLKVFGRINISDIRENLLKTFNLPKSVSLCNYVVKNNEIYRKCYGKYIGFKMFMDAILLSLTRIVQLPDIEFFINLGDWPLVKKSNIQKNKLFPIFSWCGSKDHLDIVLPTYDLTESTLENMGRVMLDMLSVQSADVLWDEKIEKGFWRGRDSRIERLNLIDISRKYPDLINASITNFFFFKDEEKVYGPKVEHISFMEFFKYKYQISVDGTVAAYRIPYLLGGNSIVLKQDSPYYEHFYHKLIPDKHFIPFKRDLSDLVDKLKWLKKNDKKAKEVFREARHFIQENLLPVQIYCYHILLFKEWSKINISPVEILPHMEKVDQNGRCKCHFFLKDEM